ncbi:copper chaperone PCu(A)C [Castellaniella daejeonensis]|jgi:copper(I)-binding protein|uniref:Copper chaperone PCu(A)C n=1 Tax=Castellaniella daejeonensis TaxID=659013 RepID=A0ABN0TN01_9BURK|nr:copper chaperone PCu(A)C [Castellaniella sp.]HET8702850.1 copper chaperone PCu(A)C [Castellaniella sp.]
MTRTLGISAGLLLAVSASAWAHGHGAAQGAAAKVSATVKASDCWIRLIPSPAPSGGFFVAHNAGQEDAVLTGAHSPDYGMVMLHETTESGGMSKMSMVHQVAIPAGKDLAFKPGSYHLMLEQPRAGLKVGDTVQVDFTLANGEVFSAACEVKSPKAMSGGHDMSGHMKH